ncbi:MAG: hypothetical protein CEE43_17555 [Promethearchaeota archaeon Loki_b32]|nr:MAG: hypothetical protein CEE43_17555 [Candidatus Lokiarchaeota archaeon Loki_b32]
MDFKDFKDGLTSLSLLLSVFSLTLIIGSIALKPYIGLEPQERDLIVILCTVNFFFSLFYLWNAIRLEKIFRLENKNIIKFGKIMGFATLIYVIHLIIFTTLFLRDLHNLELVMIFLVFLIEIMLVGLVLKEVCDLIFMEESQRDFEIEENRKKYIEREKNPILGDEV